MIRTKDNLIEWLEDHVYIPTCRWSLENDKIEVLGFFLIYDKDPLSAFMVALTSRHGFTNHLAVVSHNHNSTYDCRITTEPLWRYWNPEDSTNPLFAGDNPEKYKELRDEAKKIHQAKKSAGIDTSFDGG